ncbi:MAG: 5-formyltetrahydrofolate cyclo-ligase [Alphaproteobacteria bacterium MarineAlpha10_Bin2]|nr:MAG: 5-formyltetrahydrofolate cyclo-ligase [Alphaproteobacteria bacterium MarineAlpha10_Bin2]
MNSSDAVWQAKNALREYAGARRRLAHRQSGPGAGVRAADHFLANVPVAPGAIVSGYWPIRDEFDVMPVMRRLSGAGYRCALPFVDKKRHVLIFREWRPGTVMLEGPFRIPEPTEEAAVLTPSLLLVPLLAYDSEGFRLGYGGGYYDGALADLRAADGPVLAVGMAFSEQLVERVPHGTRDQQLDWIVTERGAMLFAGEIQKDAK